MFSFLSVIGNK